MGPGEWREGRASWMRAGQSCRIGWNWGKMRRSREHTKRGREGRRRSK